MKKILTLTLFFATLISACKQKTNDKIITAIEADIKKNAMGVEIGYKAGTLDTVIIVDAKTSICDFAKEVGTDVSKNWEESEKYYTNLYEEAQKADDNDTYHVWKWQTEHIKRLRKMKPTDVDYKVFKYSYTINDLMNEKERRDVSNYYYFNANDSLLVHLDEDSMKKLKAEHIKSATMPYKIGLLTAQTGI